MSTEIRVVVRANKLEKTEIQYKDVSTGQPSLCEQRLGRATKQETVLVERASDLSAGDEKGRQFTQRRLNSPVKGHLQDECHPVHTQQCLSPSIKDAHRVSVAHFSSVLENR